MLNSAPMFASGRPAWLLLLLLLCSAFDWPGAQPRLEYALRHGEIGERVDAVRRIARVEGDPAAELLLVALEDPELQVQLAAAATFEVRESPRSVPVLQDLLRLPEPALRMAGARALGHQLQMSASAAREPAMAALIAALSDTEPGVRAAVATALANLDSIDSNTLNKVQATFQALLTAPDEHSQLSALEALAQVPPTVVAAVAPAQLPRLPQLPPALHPAAIRALSRLHTSTALSTLSAYLRNDHAPIAGRLVACHALPQLAQALGNRDATSRAGSTLRAQLAENSHPRKADEAAQSPVATTAATPRDDLTRLASCSLDGLATLGDQGDFPILADHLTRPALEANAGAAIELLINRAVVNDDTDAQTQLLSALLDALQRAPDQRAQSAVLQQLLRMPSALNLNPMQEALATAYERHPLPGLALLRARAGDPLGLSPLVANLGANSTDAESRAQILEMLQRAPRAQLHAMVSSLVELLDSIPVAQRPPWLQLLAESGTVEALIALSAQLMSESATSEPDVSMAALKGLVTLGRRVDPADLLSDTQAQTTVNQLSAKLQSWMSDRRLGHDLRQAAALAMGTWAQPHHADTIASLLGQVDMPRLPLLVGLETAVANWTTHQPFARAPQTNAEGAAIGADETGLPSSALAWTLGKLLGQEDPALAHAAAFVLGRHQPREASRHLAAALQAVQVSRRRTAATALGLLPPTESRPLLRYLLRHSPAEVRLGAVIGLAEAGQERDLSSLLKLTRKDHWPTPAAVAFALRRWLERSVVRPRVAERALCGLPTHDPLVRINVAAAMTIAGGLCPERGLQPNAMMTPNRPTAERLAGAHWLQAALAAGRFPEAAGRALRMRCATIDPAEAVRNACLRPPAVPSSQDANTGDVTHLALQILDGIGQPMENATVLAEYELGALAPLQTGPSGLLFLPYRSGPPQAIRNPAQLPPR